MKVFVAHCAWLPERKATLNRIIETLPVGTDLTVLASAQKEHASVWATRAWRRIAGCKEPVILLNDDVVIHPQLPAVVSAMIEAVGERPIALHTSGEDALVLQQAGARWVRCYWYTGPAVVLFPEHAAGLLRFVDSAPVDWIHRTNEDVWAIHWAWSRQDPFWSPIPAPVVHDTSVSSSLGYDKHPNRTTLVPWSDDDPMTSAAFWRLQGDPPHMANPWMDEASMDFTRRVIRSGGMFCPICATREGIVGSQAGRVCRQCLVQCVSTLVGRT